MSVRWITEEGERDWIDLSSVSRSESLAVARNGEIVSNKRKMNEDDIAIVTGSGLGFV